MLALFSVFGLWHRTAHADDPKPLEVVVEGEPIPAPHASRDATAASYVVREADLKSPGADASAVLERAPGVQISRTGATSDLSTASIRGATSAQTPVYLAGVRINDDVTGTADLSTVPLWMLHRVEVYRGNAPGDADQLGVGGAIFFEPRLPRDDRAGVGATVGSFGEKRAWVAFAAGGPDAAALVGVRRSAADNDYTFLDDGGTTSDPTDDRERRRPNADFTAYDVWSIGRYRLGERARVTTIVNGFDREQGVNGPLSNPARSARTRVRRALAGVSAALPCSPSRPGEPGDGCELELTTLGIASSHVIDDPRSELNLLTTHVASVGRRVAGRARLSFRVGDTSTIHVGGAQAFESLAIDRREGTGLSARRDTTTGSVAAVIGLTDGLDANLLARAECHTTRGVESSDACAVLEPSGRAGIRIRPSRRSAILANVGRYVRAPTLAETFGTSAFVRGNPDLDTERGISADVGYRLGLGTRQSPVATFLDVFGFGRWSSDLVAFRRSSPGVITPFNVGRTRVLGAELAGLAEWFRLVRTETSVTVTDPRDITSGRTLANDVLPFQSRLVVSQLVEAYREPGLTGISLERVSLGARATHRASRFADPAGLRVLPAQTVVDVELATLWARGHLGARLRVENVADEPRLDAVGFLLPGRSVHASAEAWWW